MSLEELSTSQFPQKRSFASLIANRDVKRRRLQSKQELHEKALDLLIRNQNLTELFRETASGSETGTNSCGLRTKDVPEQTAVAEIGVSLLEREVRREAEQLGVPVEVLSTQVLVDMLIGSRQQGGGVSAMLSSDERAQVSVLLEAARKLLTVGIFSPKHLWQDYWKAQPVLEVVYHLHTKKLLLLEDILLSGESGVSVWLVAQLQCLCASRVTDEAEGEMRQQILSTVVCELVCVGFQKAPGSAVAETSCSVLDHMLSWMLVSLGDTNSSQAEQAAGVWLRVFDMPLFGASVTEDTLRGFFRHTLTHILTHRPRLRVSEAIARQSQWSFAKTTPLLASLCCKVCVLFSMEEVLVHLQQVLETLEVNWQNVLSCLSTLLVYHVHTQACLKELLSRLLSSAFHTYDVEKMITAFLLARQGALEGPAVFPSYSDWFKMSFGGTSGYHGNSKKSLLFLLKFLSDLVPFDPPQYLKVHIMHPPYIIGKHRALLQEYISLAKTRLSDLKVSVEEMGLYEAVSGAVTEARSRCPAQQDAEKAVALFQSTGRISATVMEASIFRRPYFLTRFLPVLLTPRVLPQTPDGTMGLIEALRRAEKIPAALYTSYTEACVREQQAGGAGVCESLEQEGSPHMDVQTQLQQLRRLLNTGANEADVRAQLSRLSQAMGRICPDSPDDQIDHTVIKLTLDMPTTSHTVASVVDLVLRGFCQCVLDASRASPPHRQGQWATMFLRMLLGHQKLFSALLLRVFQLLHHQGPSLAAAHVLGLAVFLVEMHVCREQCPLVEVLACSAQSACLSPAEALSTALPAATANHMHFSLRLSVATLCYALCRSVSQGEELHHWVPGRLYKQLLFLMPRLLPETRAGLVAMAEGSVFSEEGEGGDEECSSAWASVTDSGGGVRSSVRTMWKNTAIRRLWNRPEHQLSFSEWLMAELRVQRSLDALSESERQMYERWVCLQWFLPLGVANGGCGGSSVTACKHIINAVLDTGMRSEQVLCVPAHTDSCCVDVLSRLQELVWELEFVRAHRRTEGEEGHFLWDLIEARCSVTSDPENIGTELELQRTLHTCESVLLALPAMVLVSAAGGRNLLDCRALMEHINNHQRRVCCPAATLSCSLTGHFLSAVFSASVKCESPVEAVNTTLSQLSMTCPLLLVSMGFWWCRLSPMLCSLCERVMGEQPALIQLLTACHDWASRSAQGLSPDMPSAPPVLLAVCLHRAFEQQGGNIEHIKANLTLSPERHRQVLVFLMFFYTTDLLCAHLRPQDEKRLSRARDLSVHLLTLMVDSSDWLSLFHTSGSGQENSYQCVSMVTTDVNIRLMPFAFFSVLASTEAGVLGRVLGVPGFLHTAVMSYVALLRLFLHGHTAPVSSEAPPLQLLARAQCIVLNSVQQSSPSVLAHNQWSQLQAECEELDPEVGSALSRTLRPSNPGPDLRPDLDPAFGSCFP